MWVFNPDTPNGPTEIRSVYFGILKDWSKDPSCSKNPKTKVVAVSTPDGEPTALSALKGTHMYKYQVVTADHDAQLTFGDGSVYRVTKGTTFKVFGCDNSFYSHRAAGVLVADPREVGACLVP